MSQFSVESFCLPVQVHHFFTLSFLISLQNSQTEVPLGCCIRLRCRSLNFIGIFFIFGREGSSIPSQSLILRPLHFPITSYWNWMNAGLTTACMLSTIGGSSTNTDVPQRTQPPVATTSWSREWNHAQGEILLAHLPLLISLQCELWWCSLVCYTGGYALLCRLLPYQTHWSVYV